jgi:hypothetical protein
MAASNTCLLGPGADARSARHVRCAPGESIPRPQPGDVILIHGRGWLGKLIRAAQHVRYRRAEDRPFVYWSHAALVITPAGHLIEVVHRGAILSHIEKYRGHDYHYVHCDLPEDERFKAVRFAYSCLKQKYGLLAFLGLGLAVLLGDRLQVPDRGQQGCVALIVRALQHAGLTFARRPTDMMPADLAKQFNVLP